MGHQTYGEGHVPLGLAGIKLLDGFVYASFRLIRPCRAGELSDEGVEVTHTPNVLDWLGPKATLVPYVPLIWRINPRADLTQLKGVSMEPYFVVAPQLDFAGTDIGELLRRLVPR